MPRLHQLGHMALNFLVRNLGQRLSHQFAVVGIPALFYFFALFSSAEVVHQFVDGDRYVLCVVALTHSSPYLGQASLELQESLPTPGSDDMEVFEAELQIGIDLLLFVRVSLRALRGLLLLCL